MNYLINLEKDIVEKCQDVLFEANADIAYFSGGIRWGLGHAMSDIDIYVFGNFDLDKVKNKVENLKTKHQIQFNVVDKNSTKKVFDYCDPTCGGCTTDRKYNSISNDAFMKWVGAVSYGQIVHASNEGKKEIKRIDPQHVVRSAMSRWAILATRHLEDTYGCLKSGIRTDAVRAAVLSIESAINCVLAGEGDLYVGEKSLIRRTERSEILSNINNNIIEIYKKAAIVDTTTPIDDLVSEIVRIASSLVNYSLLNLWDYPIGTPAEYNLPVSTIRNEFYTLTRYVDAICITGLDQGYRATEKMARYWSEIDHQKELNGKIKANKILLDADLLKIDS